jgi:hypothetical protein
MDLSVDRWRRLDLYGKEAEAKQLAKGLPVGFAFESIRSFSAIQDPWVATYRFKDANFVLVPSTTATIGFDTEREWIPTPEEEESWDDTGAEYGFDSTIKEHIEQVTLRPRTVVTKPLLVETKAHEVGWERIGFNDPEVQEIIREYGNNRNVEFCRGDVSTRVRTTDDGPSVAERALQMNYHDVSRQFHDTGFRLPTSDEWEFLCGCGSPTLFRWGDHAPCDRYPIDVSRDDWDLHRRPNPFGLLIAFNPYKCELVAEPGLTRGGDGGGTICGGAGFFVGWLTLATSYFEEEILQHDPNESIGHGYSVGRRVLELN